MNSEWFSARELTGIAGLPSSPQGINQMARREKWVSQRRKGVQGKAVEYHIDSLPPGVRSALMLKEDPAGYAAERQDPLAVWNAYFHYMSDDERAQILTFLLREGIGGLLALIAEGRQR
ncbi:Mu DNA-binding domain [Serratia rubidaea]|uniref:Mu DNA-binding domain n=2 Tax=Serratia rubidaea TaxID=61652 RepID=A0A4V6JGM5_SERRU|nr:DNA-binding protein [Serratia rubidaea]MBD8453142.1 putative DNA-binding transcriptional regulator [Serratia rubidaea]MCR0999607.1 putative DNA-binding transcriptional regulator [Serratia rubidaea]MDC6112670.1 DNA-binding protein [Serratia rubidaea]MDK1706354.1 DNA-binding protein [Serratia rubidaea]QPR65327.1 putative DNA-binding transcriptional regulator [Serratia rubidaea]